MLQHLCPLVLDHHVALGDYSADVIVGAEKPLQTFRIITASKLCTKILQILRCVDKGIGPAIGILKCIQHLYLEYSPVLFHVSALHDSGVSNIGVFHTVVREHRNGIRATGIGTSEGSEAFVLV